jgi:hypothetical protein
MTDTPQILLAHHLKALKLPTILREYDKLARQCATDAVDHVRYLLRLAELELIERERRMVERRIREAKFPTVKSLDSFDFPALPSLNKTLIPSANSPDLPECPFRDRDNPPPAQESRHPESRWRRERTGNSEFADGIKRIFECVVVGGICIARSTAMAHWST